MSESRCTSTYRKHRCALDDKHGGPQHVPNPPAEPWPMHLPYSPETGYGEPPSTDTTLVTTIEAHATLGARCTCGEVMPEERLDTRRWFAEHMAEQVLTYMERRYVEVNQR